MSSVLIEKTRCQWVTDDPLYIAYHDQEWGLPLYDDQKLFELLVLEGMQAGLSWLTILKKRNHYRECFEKFSPKKIAQFNSAKIDELLLDPGIIRNRLKIQSIIINAQCYLELTKKQSFSDYLWEFVDHKPQLNKWSSLAQIPATHTISDKMSKDLKKKGFKFIGSTICYAFMQASGMVNDHTTDCFRYKEINP
jgi:DNA-3-methyladenine glycosylase I